MTTFSTVSKPTPLRDKLPIGARTKLEHLRRQHRDAQTLTRNVSQLMRESYEEKMAVEGHIGMLRVSYPHLNPEKEPQIISARARLAEIGENEKLLRGQLEDYSERSNSLHHLLSALDIFVGRLPASAPAFPGCLPPVAKTNQPLDVIAKIRDRVCHSRDAIQAAIDAPIHSARAKEIAAAMVERLAARARPNVLATIEGARDPVFPKPLLIHALAEDLVDPLALSCWLHKDTMIAALNREINEAADDSEALTDAQRAVRIASARAELLKAEREEEAAIEYAESIGIQVIRRVDADPRAVLGLADATPVVEG